MELTAEHIEKNAHIPTEEIEQDILDTEYEIATMRREAHGLKEIGDKMSLFRASARESGIKERLEFVAKLKALLVARSTR